MSSRLQIKQTFKCPFPHFGHHYSLERKRKSTCLMAQHRPPPGSRSRAGLEDSWVPIDESSESSDEYDSEDQQATDLVSSRESERIRDRHIASSPLANHQLDTTSTGPELIMPSINTDPMRRSQVDSSVSAETRQRVRRPETLENTTRTAPSQPRERRRRRVDTQERLERIFDVAERLLMSIFRWTFDVLGKSLSTLKTPLAYALAIYLFLGAIIFLRNLLTASVYSALSPICRVPGSSFLQLPMCKSSLSANYAGHDTLDNPPVEFDQLMNVQSKFESIMEESAHGLSLPRDMKRGEASIRDLRTVVKFSHLHSRNELVLEFDGFIDTARLASLDLQKFNSHVGRSVDMILSTNRWTRRVLDDIAIQRSERGAILAFVNDRLLGPFQPVKFTESKLLEQYIEHTQVVESEIERLVEEAQALLQILQNLEDRLDLINEIAVRDDVYAKDARDEILAQLWTKLGGNRSKVDKFDSQISLLRHVNQYRRAAFDHVSATIVKLQAMGSELEELRERVAGPSAFEDKAKVPLRVHIENIEMGVERLETGRDKLRKTEEAQYRKVLDREDHKEERLGRYIAG